MTDKDKTTAEIAAEEQAAIQAAITPGTSTRRPGIAKAQQAELDRQEAVVKAVAKSNETELAKLGGDLLEPGLGR